MKSSSPIVRPLNSLDVIKAYGKRSDHTVQGYVIELDGEIIGIAGVTYSRPMQAFSKVLDDRLRKYPRVIVETGRKMRAIMDTISAPLYAIADPKEGNSERFLRSLGFSLVDKTSQGLVYKRWHKQSHI